MPSSSFDLKPSTTPVVYLDSQDYSRFGDVIRGRCDSETENIFSILEDMARAGDVIFPLTMPLLSELFQYDSNYRDTTMCKAQALQRLCGSWALAFPSRLVAAEIAFAASRSHRLQIDFEFSPLSNQRYWFPDVSDALEGLNSEIRQTAAEAIDRYPANRALRRRAKSRLKTYDMSSAIADAVPEFAAKFGLPAQAVRDSVVALLNGEISTDVASRRLFGAIADPLRFAEIYFERLEGDNTALPLWMRKFGATFEEKLTKLRELTAPLAQDETGRESLEVMLSEWPARLANSALRMAEEDIAEFGLDVLTLAELAQIDGFALQVPSARIIGNVLTEYVSQITGLRGSSASIERSFGGDLVHAMYLPHVDLWRADRRFAAVVSRAVPDYQPRIVAQLRDLPRAIASWQNPSGASC